MNTSPRKVSQITRDLVSNHSKTADLVDREFSYGKDGDSMLSVQDTGIKLGWKLTNETDADQVVYITPFQILGSNVDQGGRCVLPSGLAEANVVFGVGTQTIGGKNFTIVELDGDRKIKDFRGFANSSAIQVPKIHLKSRNLANNNADDTNYENSINSYWVSPFYPAEKKTFLLRTLQDSRMNSPQFAEADFLAHGFNALISQEHILAIKVNKGTELAVTMSIGAYDSRAQRMFRATRDANKLLKSLRF